MCSSDPTCCRRAMARRKKSEDLALSSSFRNCNSPPGSNCDRCGKVVEKASEARWLGTVDEVPAYQRRPFILKFYRLEVPRLRHFWHLHNEFGNMWTHIVALVLTAWRFLAWIRSDLPGDAELSPARSTYAVGVVGFFVASLVTFAVSVTYHWRHCSNECEARCWLCLDISCCGLLLLGGFLSGVPMGFHCYPELQLRYVMQSVLVALAAVGAFASETAATRGDWSTPVLIIGGLSALIPALHWLLLCRPGREAAGAWLLLVIFCGSLASAVYSRSIPERYRPGHFDMVGNSHQLWHVFIYGAIAAYSEALVTVFSLTASPAFCL